MRKLLILCVLSLCSCQSAPEGGYKIGYDPDWEYASVGATSGRVVAFSNELVHTIGNEESFKVAWGPAQTSMVAHNLKNGRIDGFVTAMPPLAENRSRYDFSDVYLPTGPVLVVPTTSMAKSLDDMADKTVGVAASDQAMVLVSQIPDVVTKEYANLGHALEELLSGRIDGLVMPSLPAYAYLADFYASQLKVVTPPLTDDGLRLVVLRGKNADLLSDFNKGLKTVKASSTYKSLVEKWELHLPAQDVEEGRP